MKLCFWKNIVSEKIKDFWMHWSWPHSQTSGMEHPQTNSTRARPGLEWSSDSLKSLSFARACRTLEAPIRLERAAESVAANTPTVMSWGTTLMSYETIKRTTKISWKKATILRPEVQRVSGRLKVRSWWSIAVAFQGWVHFSSQLDTAFSVPES